MISIFHKTIKDERISRIKKNKKGSWISVVDPKENDIEFLNRLGIDQDFIEDAVDPDELPRIEEEKDGIYIVLNIPEKKGSIPLSVVLTRDNFITISTEDSNILKSLAKNPTTQKTKNLIELCILITNLYTKEIRRINKKINSKKVSLEKLKNSDITSFVELEDVLNDFITSIVSLIGVFEKIRKSKRVKIFEHDEELLEDLIIDSYQSLDMCRTSIKKIINTREAYSTILTNKLNNTMKMLASLTIILGIPTIIASLYGMNVTLPLQSNPLAFFFVLGFTLIISVVLIIIFYINKWF